MTVTKKVNFYLLEKRHHHEDTVSGRVLCLLGPNLRDTDRMTGAGRMRDACCLHQEDGGKAEDIQHFRGLEFPLREVSAQCLTFISTICKLGRTRKNSLLPSSGDGRKNSLLPGTDSGGRRSSLLPPGYSQRRKSSARRNSTFDAFLQKKGGRKFSINDDDDEENKLGKNPKHSIYF